MEKFDPTPKSSLEEIVPPSAQSAEYFATPEGAKLKKKILSALPDLDKTKGNYYLDQFKIAQYFQLARIKYYLGESLTEDIRKSLQLGEELKMQENTVTLFKNIHSDNFSAGLVSLYADLHIPPDKNIASLISERITKNTNQLSLEKALHEPLLSNIACLYAEHNQPVKALEILNNHFKLPFYRVKILNSLLQHTNNKDEAQMYINEVLSSCVQIKKQKEDIKDEIHPVIVHITKQGQYDEAEKLIKLLSSDYDKALMYVNLAFLRNCPKENKDTYIEKAISYTSNLSEHDTRKNDNYGRLAALFLNNGEYNKAQEILGTINQKSGFNASVLVDLVEPDKLRNDPTVRQTILDYFSEEKNLAQSPDKTKIKGLDEALVRLGFFQESLGRALKNNSLFDLSKNLAALNTYLKTPLPVSENKDQIPFSFDSMLTNSKRAFAAGVFFPDSALLDAKDVPEHIQLAYDLGTHLEDKTLPPLYLQKELSPQMIRTFLLSMENYNFESIPEALELLFENLPPEGDEIVNEFIATHPEISRRLIKVLISIDATKGTRFATNLITRKNTPDKVFSYFGRLFVEHGRFTRNFLPYLYKNEDIPHLRRLLSNYPNEFNNVLDTLADLHIPSLSSEHTIWEALNDLGSITPGIYNQYRSLSGASRAEFVEQLKHFDYTSFFTNKPLMETGEENGSMLDSTVRLDLLYRAYKPVNMSYEQVRELMSKVPDRTTDLKSYVFPESYELKLSTPTFLLKEGEKINDATLSELKNIFSPRISEVKERNEALIKIFKITTDLTTEDCRGVLGLLNETDEFKQAKSLLTSEPSSNAYKNLSYVKEVMGIFAKDTLPAIVEKVIVSENLISRKTDSLLSNPDRRKNLLKALGCKTENDQTKDISTIELAIRLFVDTSLAKYTTMINKELRKFKQTTEGQEGDQKAQAYISKNKGSFFAKASAGLCTAQDMELWNRKNHFHINIVSDSNKVQGIVLGYIEKIKGKKSLVLRGFNPSTEYLKEITGTSYVEEALRIARIFKAGNQLEHIYLVNEGIGNALSNRPEINTYLNSKYIPNLAVVSHTMKVSGNGQANNILLLE
jgi:hypothetical protein